MTKRRADGGFTMTEMMVTLAVIGILAAIAIPSILGVMPRIKLGSAAQTLAGDIAVLRMTAISRSSDAEVRLDPAGERYSLAKAVGSAPYAVSPLPANVEMEGLTYFDDAAAAVDTIRLRANGAVEIYNSGTRVSWRPDISPDRGMICVVLRTKDGEHRRRVVLSMMGRIRSQKWSGSGWVED